MKNKKLNTEKLLTLASAGISRWELDNITWHDRASNPETLTLFLERISFLENLEEQQALRGKQTTMVAKRHVAVEQIFNSSSGFNSNT